MTLNLRTADYMHQHLVPGPIQTKHVYNAIPHHYPDGSSQPDIAIQTLSLQLAYDSFQQYHLLGLYKLPSLNLI